MAWRDFLPRFGKRDETLEEQRARLEADYEAYQRALIQPQYRQGTIRRGITATEQQPTAGQLLTDGYSGVQAIASRAIANRVSDLEFRVQERIAGEDGTRKWEDDDDHALLEPLLMPNSLLSTRQLLKLTSYWLTQSGAAYWLVVTNGGGRVVELWPMSPRNVEKIVGNDSPVDGFIFHGEAGETRYGIEEVIWISDPDPADPFEGVGIVGPQAREFDAATFAADTVRQHFQHDAVPKTYLQAGPDAQMPDAPTRKLFNADWRNKYSKRGGTDIGLPSFIPSGFTLGEISGSSNLDEIRAYQEYGRDLLLMANGVPRSILGDVVDANRAAADTNRLVFDRHTVSPQAGLICDAITHQLAVPEYGRETRVRFREFVSADEDLRLREEQQDLALKVRSINQVRDDRGAEPVEWGEKPVGSFADTPYDGDEKDAPPNPFNPFGTGSGGDTDDHIDDAPDENIDDDESEDDGRAFIVARVSPRIAAHFTSERAWSRMLLADSEHIPKMVAGLRRVFGGQKALTLDALAKNPEAVRASLEGGYSRADFVDELFEGQDFKRLFDVLVTPIRESVYAASGNAVLLALEHKPLLSFDEAAIKSMREQGAELVAYANDTTKKRLRSTLAEAIAGGDTQAEQAARVRKVFNAASKSRARTIARTEVGHAVSSGQLAGYAEAGDVVSGLTWNTAIDERVRDSHQMDGAQAQPFGALFTLLDGERARAPRIAEDGGRLSAHNGINCRCFETPIVGG
jgi:SPP1 gp7 family putative phage head morphogenesis protein